VGLYSASASATIGGKESKSSSEIDKDDKLAVSSVVRYFTSAILTETNVFHCYRVVTQGTAVVWMR
jgi:hypothetical protein